MTIWACQAGKDVYVEKPISHNVWEGRKIVEAAQKYGRIVQAGTQNRSDTGFRDAVQYIREGHLGDIQWIHSVWYKFREGIGKVEGPQEVPEYIDYNLWTGPAPLKSLMRKNLHYDWHWFWDTGNGDMGNLGAHQIDDACFIINDPGMPLRIRSFGGRFVVDDDAETPNTQVAFFDFDQIPVILELRNLPMKQGIRAMDHLRGIRMGNVVQCENGFFAGGRGGGWVYENDGTRRKQFPGDGGKGHQANFIEAVRRRDARLLHANAEVGQRSAALCHFANISYSLGDPAIPNDMIPSWETDQAEDTLIRIKDHLASNELDLDKPIIKNGPWLEIDPVAENVRGITGEKANPFLKRDYREPFTIDEIV